MALGVDVRLGVPVTAIHEDGVEVGGELLRSYNIIWAAGVRAAPVGDPAYLVDPQTGREVLGVSQGALQMGRYVAKVIQEDLKGRRRHVTP